MMDDATLLSGVGGCRYALVVLPLVASRTLKGGCVGIGLLQPSRYSDKSLPVGRLWPSLDLVPKVGVE